MRILDACFLTVVTLCVPWSYHVRAQSTASIGGKIVDQNGAVIPGVQITAGNSALDIERLTETDAEGGYQIAALPVGDYRLEVRAGGFQTQIVESVRVEVGRRITQDFQLRVGEVSQEVSVTAAGQLIEHAAVSVGQVIDRRTVQELPLNGRRFIDLGLLVPRPAQSLHHALACRRRPQRQALLLRVGGFAECFLGEPEEDRLLAEGRRPQARPRAASAEPLQRRRVKQLRRREAIPLHAGTVRN